VIGFTSSGTPPEAVDQPARRGGPLSAIQFAFQFAGQFPIVENASKAGFEIPYLIERDLGGGRGEDQVPDEPRTASLGGLMRMILIRILHPMGRMARLPGGKAGITDPKRHS
jgi:hypothetical protein